MPIDPITAIADAIAALANAHAATMTFLSTTQGQAVVATELKALSDLMGGINQTIQNLQSLFRALHPAGV